MSKKGLQIDLEDSIEEQAITGDKIPPPPQAYYDFNKSVPVSSTVTWTSGPSLTRQEFAEECDINVLMARYENQDIGAIMRRSTEPAYVDFTEVPSDLMGYMNLMQDAENAFMTLPATVRREFDNDPVRFVDYASQDENLDQMRTWGLAPPAPQPPVATPEPPVAPSPPDKPAG